MAANVLNSEGAVEASVQVVRTFVKLRQILASNADLAKKLDQLERKYDHQFKIVFDAIRQLSYESGAAKGHPIRFRPKTHEKSMNGSSELANHGSPKFTPGCFTISIYDALPLVVSSVSGNPRLAPAFPSATCPYNSIFSGV